jgi:hypothetical protein
MKPNHILVSIALGSALVVAGCAKKQPEQTPATTPKTPVAEAGAESTAPGTAARASAAAPGPAEASAPTPAQLREQLKAPVVTPPAPRAAAAQVAQKIAELESAYRSTLDFSARVELIYQLSSVDSPETLDAIGRLFLNETDQELKIELLDSLFDIEGHNDRKLTILSAALRADQPKEVREEAIDLMIDVEDPRAIQILQGLLNDPDAEIRDAAQDAIEQIRLFLSIP